MVKLRTGYRKKIAILREIVASMKINYNRDIENLKNLIQSDHKNVNNRI